MSKFKIGNIKGPKGDRGETGAVGPKGEQGIQGPAGPAGGVNSVNGMKGDVDLKLKQKTMNLEVGSWKENGGIWLYDIELPGVLQNQDVSVEAPPGLTENIINAFAEATVTGKEQLDEKIVLQAFNKPTIELPIVIKIGGVVENA